MGIDYLCSPTEFTEVVKCSLTSSSIAEGKELREINGREYLLEYGLTADYALIKGLTVDGHGNVLYNKTARNFAPIMATAARVTIVQAADVVGPTPSPPDPDDVL